MALPPLKFGGIDIVLHAGPPEQSADPLEASTVLRMSGGFGIKMTAWEKAAGTISGQGWMPPGLDGLDYSAPIELRSTQVSTMQGTVLEYTLPDTPRPDVEPWAFALLGDQWQPTPCVTDAGVATVTAVVGAELYQVWWLPVYSVYARRPAKQQSSATGTQSWSINWEEV